MLTVFAAVVAVITGVAAPASAAAPEAYDDFYSTKVDTAVGIYPYAYDPDGDPVTIQITTGPASGTLDDCSTGFCTYTPNAGFTGTDTIMFTGVAGGETSNEATITIEVRPNTPPEAYDTFETVKIDTPKFMYLGGWDPDGDAVTFLVTSGPSSGTLDDCSFGYCTYTPNAGFTGADGFTFTVSDGQAISAEATVGIDVVPNSAPEAYDVTYTTSVDTELFVYLSADDADGDPLTYTVTSGPSSGTLDDCSFGYCTYTPATGFLGSDSFTFTASDGEATSNEATATPPSVARRAGGGMPEAGCRTRDAGHGMPDTGCRTRDAPTGCSVSAAAGRS